MRTEEVHMPKELLWDYKKPPEDVLWRLQRITDFFPAYGTDRKTVKLLFEYRDKLKLEEGKYKLFAIYNEVWNEGANEGIEDNKILCLSQDFARKR